MRLIARASAMALVLAAVPAAAQRQDVGALQAAQRGAIAKLAWMNGRWRGEAITQTPTGDHRVTQTERIGDLLGGTIKLVEGRGFQADGTIGFNAFGVVSFDPSTGKYAFHTYAQGRAGDFAFTPTDDGYVWEIPAGPMTIRYTARLAGGLWTETGERIVVGRPAQPFFVMHLRRIGDSDWPEAGAMSPK